MTCTQPSISAHFCFILMPMFLLGSFPEPEETATHCRLSNTHWGRWAPWIRAWGDLFWYASLIKALFALEKRITVGGCWCPFPWTLCMTLAALQVMKTFLFLFAVLFFLDPGKENEHLYMEGDLWWWPRLKVYPENAHTWSTLGFQIPLVCWTWKRTVVAEGNFPMTCHQWIMYWYIAFSIHDKLSQLWVSSRASPGKMLLMSGFMLISKNNGQKLKEELKWSNRQIFFKNVFI